MTSNVIPIDLDEYKLDVINSIAIKLTSTTIIVVGGTAIGYIIDNKKNIVMNQTHDQLKNALLFQYDNIFITIS